MKVFEVLQDVRSILVIPMISIESFPITLWLATNSIVGFPMRIWLKGVGIRVCGPVIDEPMGKPVLT